MAERLLDARELEPPEPLERTLEAVRGLPAGDYLRMIHRRHPCLLGEHLDRLGFAYHFLPGAEEGGVETLIWRLGDEEAERAAHTLIP